ncbi:serine hydrolase domain-containing protein [Paeniglutamicibacter cryotolerans]|uniref:CubicO group peptidase (Beta-lactamase class C family) n=1 Tax=Paeniglutamicibacter cryotolerans TaxID=670079 RepID=A0A839QLV3_9MICC|nr:serine hydrolase domain-containing protein [Paeniglutamicibacter cryotolerans]MBB2997408.1 CubicO group peptidase (beta-lactamase class C family) [Paeniglutamicibacter cryotolerans]
MSALEIIDSWPVDHAAAAVIDASGTLLDSHGDASRVFALASVTKLLSAYAVLVAVEEEALELEQPAGPEGSTVRHLLAHTAGYDFSGTAVRAAPGTRRIYSNTGFDVLARTLEESTGIGFADYLDEAVLQPLGMSSTSLAGSAAADGSSCVADLLRFATELQRPTLLAPSTLHSATTVQFPGLDGILPGYGRQRPNDWGLGFEIRGSKSPHWTGTGNSAKTFGHFGQAGTFLWVDPEAGISCIALTDRDFGPWAVEAWTPFNDAVLSAFAGPGLR